MKMPDGSSTIDKINQAIIDEVRPPRGYLGASIIGEECSRKLWYGYHRPSTITNPRTLRIFRLGDILETEIVRLLRLAGFEVQDVKEDGSQFGFKMFDGKFAGHTDGFIKGIPEAPTKTHVAEYKSYNKQRFEALKKDGLRRTAPTYVAQMMVYMGAFELQDALLVAYCKDNSELYTERLKFAQLEYDGLISKAKDIIEREIPAREYPKQTFYKCRWCDYNEECWSDN